MSSPKYSATASSGCDSRHLQVRYDLARPTTGLPRRSLTGLATVDWTRVLGIAAISRWSPRPAAASDGPPPLRSSSRRTRMWMETFMTAAQTGVCAGSAHRRGAVGLDDAVEWSAVRRPEEHIIVAGAAEPVPVGPAEASETTCARAGQACAQLPAPAARGARTEHRQLRPRSLTRSPWRSWCGAAPYPRRAAQHRRSLGRVTARRRLIPGRLILDEQSPTTVSYSPVLPCCRGCFHRLCCCRHHLPARCRACFSRAGAAAAGAGDTVPSPTRVPSPRRRWS